MSILHLALRRETRAPVLALLVATFATVGLVVARILWTGQVRYSFLSWNLFLAWVPLVFALLAHDSCQRSSARNWKFVGFGATWLLFLPNSSYIFTDIIHLTHGFYRHFWIDMVLIVTCAFTGLVLGFLSLYLMQSVVEQTLGRFASWLFIAFAAGLSGLGVYIGRFMRFNSWDIFLKPWTFFEQVSNLLMNPAAHPSYVFPLLFAAFLFISYLMLYALTHLQQLTPKLCPANGAQTSV